MGRAVPMMLTALSTYHAGVPQLVLVDDGGIASGTLRAVARTRYLPTMVTVPVAARHRDALTRLLPWTQR